MDETLPEDEVPLRKGKGKISNNLEGSLIPGNREPDGQCQTDAVRKDVKGKGKMVDNPEPSNIRHAGTPAHYRDDPDGLDEESGFDSTDQLEYSEPYHDNPEEEADIGLDAIDDIRNRIRRRRRRKRRKHN